MSIFAAAWRNRIGSRGLFAGLLLALGMGLAIALLPLTWASLLVAGAVVAGVVVVQPRLGLLLVAQSVPLDSPALGQVRVGTISIGPTEAILGLTLASWLMRRVLQRGRAAASPRPALPALALPLAVLLGAMILSLWVTFSLQYSAKEIVKWLEVLAVYLLVALDMDARWRRALVGAVLLAGALAALHGIYQFLFQVGPEAFVLFGRYMRAYGTFEQPNPYAGYLGLTLPLAVALTAAAVLRAGRWSARERWLLPAAAGVSGALMLAALVMSWSRGAWLGFAAAVAAMGVAVVARGGRGAVLIAVLVAVVAYGLLAGGLAQLPPSLVQRFSDFMPYLGTIDVRGLEVTDANFSVLERMAHWQSAWAMWTEHPWLGVGIGNYEPIYPRYALPLWPLPLGHAHNYYLNVAAETGVTGLAAYLALWAASLLLAWRAARRRTGWTWAVALGVLGMLVHLSVHNLFDNLYVHGMYLHVAMLLGLLHSTCTEEMPF